MRNLWFGKFIVCKVFHTMILHSLNKLVDKILYIHHEFGQRLQNIAYVFTSQICLANGV